MVEEFGSSEVEFQQSGISDHSPALVSIGKFISFGPKPFKFFGFWTENDKFLDWFEEGWSITVEGSPMYRICMMLCSVKMILNVKNKEVYGGLGQRVS